MERLSSIGPNAEQITYWNEVAAQKWVSYQRILDTQIGPLGRDVMDRVAVAVGERVLDVGCGCGDTTIDLARRVGPSGAVLGIDISTPMLERARQNAAEAGVANVRFANADAQTEPLEARAFDLAFSRFGVMFFVDPTAAFTNLRRALRDGGHLGFVCWQALDKNPWMAVPMAAASRVIAFPPRLPAGAPGPFAFADPEHIRRVLGDARFTDVTIEANDTVLTVGDASLERSVEFLVQMGPTGTALRDAGTEARQKVVAAVMEAVAPYHGASGLRMEASAWRVGARPG